MRSKFYVVSKEDKVGTVFSVAKYSEDKFRRTYINKIDSNDKQAYEDIIKYLIDNDSESSIMVFKFKDTEIAKHMGNAFNKNEEFVQKSKDIHCLFQSSPAIFSKDKERMSRADSALESYLILRDHYHREGKI